MPSYEIQEMLKDWAEVSKLPIHNILLGNGFSRTYWEKFNYKSLLESFGDEPIGRYLRTKDLFAKLKTANFEEVLRAIFHAYLVSIDNLDATKTLYLDVQKALISSVNKVHPRPEYIPSKKIGECLSKYGSIFTTNYDLLPYWAVLSGWQDTFVDYFWENSTYLTLKKLKYSKGKFQYTSYMAPFI